MIVTIWRHGEAGRAATDRQRELTDRGLDDIGFGGHQFHQALEAREIAAPDIILSSPWIRTWQTAELLATAFTHAAWREFAALEPGGTVALVQEELSLLCAAPEPPSHLVLVSHQPLVSQLVGHYLGKATSVPPLSPGALVSFVLDTPLRDCGQLLFWAVPPEYEVGL